MASNIPFSLFFKAAYDICRHRVPGQLVIQITDRCNAHCPHCGMRVDNLFDRSNLSCDHIKKIIDAAALNGVKAVSFTGGEPMLRINDVAEMIQYASSAGIPFTRTGTNGYFLITGGKDSDKSCERVKRIAEKIANTALRNFWISIDSADPDVHERMRGFPGIIRGIEKALPVFHDHGLYPAVNVGINRNIGGSPTSSLQCSDFETEKEYLRVFYQVYLTAIRQFFRRVIDLGFTIMNICYPMSVSADPETGIKAVYAATSEDRIVRFTTSEKSVLFMVLLKTVNEFRSRIRIFTPLASLYTLHRQYAGSFPASHQPHACRGGIDFFFIDSKNGDTYPCGYRGKDNYGKYWNLRREQIDRHADCKLCDWECFRDPSELMSPILQTVSSPLSLLNRMKTDREYRHYWQSDLKYYRACDYFNGREEPRWKRLKRFDEKLQQPDTSSSSINNYIFSHNT